MNRKNAFVNAFHGIRAAFRDERNFRIHTVVALLALLTGYCLRLSATEWLWVSLAMAMVMAAELINTAIEALFDFVSPGEHPLAKKAKDTAAAAVLIAAVFALVVGLVIFGPKLSRQLFHE